MIKAVFFDAIDTLFCAYPNKIEMYRRIIKEKTGMDVSTEEMTNVWNEVLLETEKLAEQEVMYDSKQLAWNGFNEEILLKLGYTGDSKEKGEILRLESWSNPNNFILFPDVLETLESLSGAGFKIGCISNESKGLHNFFTHFNIDNYFSQIIISEEVECEKPGIKIFLKALNKPNLKPEEVLFVGDSIISDYKGAISAGMKAVVIDREDKISDTSVKKINKLTDILHILQMGEKNACTTS